MPAAWRLSTSLRRQVPPDTVAPIILLQGFQRLRQCAGMREFHAGAGPSLTHFEAPCGTMRPERDVRSPARTILFDDIPVRNQLLSALAPHDLATLEPHFETVHLRRRTAVFGAGESTRRVLFPESAVVSLVNTLRDGSASGVGTVGREGMVGLHVFLGDGAAPSKAVVHVRGAARSMDALVFKQLSEASGPFHRVMLRYTQAFLTQTAQTAVCNGAHLVEQRCARWLLVTSERVEAPKFSLSHDVLAFMLGVRNAGVALAMLALHDKKLIRCGHRRVEIIDRIGLEKASCECYQTVGAQYARLLAPPI